MKPSSVRVDVAVASFGPVRTNAPVAVLVPLLLAVLAPASRGAQQHANEIAPDARTFAPLLPSNDVKTPVEPARPTGVATEPPAPALRAVEPRDAKSPDPQAPVGRMHGIDHSVMHYDEPGDGSLWARGERFKMSFDADGATYYPLWGPRQPRHFPHALSPDVVTFGGDPIEFERAAQVVRSGDRIEIDRGAFVERYEMGPQSVEQVFVFSALPRADDLVVHIPLGSGLDAVEGEDAFELRSELGHVTYGRAIAIDARGARTEAPTVLADGSIEIRVDASFLAAAALPLVIDPVITTFAIDSTSYDDYLPDVAYDAGTQRWIAVYEETVTSSDKDVYYEMMDDDGDGLWGGYINSNNASWTGPRVANLRSATQFLVVARVDGSGSVAIRGRTVEADIFSVGGEFFISGPETGDEISPDVGGDSYPTAPGWYCVVYERIYSDDDRDILVRLVAPDSTLVGTGPIYLSNSGNTIDQRPSISKSNGGGTWMIAWDRHFPFQIWAGRVRYDGFVSNGPFLVETGNDDLQASASSPLFGSERTMIVWQRNLPPDWDIMGAVFDGATELVKTNLTTLANNGFQGQQQQFASVDSDGLHFSVAYAELYSTTANDWDIMVDDFLVTETSDVPPFNTVSLQVAQTRQILAYTTSTEFNPEIASKYGSGGAHQRYMVAWSKQEAAGNRDIRGGLFDGLAGGTITSFCAGDGLLVSCPCNNNGGAGHGCASSVNPAGALLSMSGSPSTVIDSSALRVEGVPATSQCLFFQGMFQPFAFNFGDGLRCVTSSIVRIGTKTASGGVAVYPGPGDPAISTAGGIPINGAHRAYQVWYRNAAVFCTTSTFNTTNAIEVRWSR